MVAPRPTDASGSARLQRIGRGGDDALANRIDCDGADWHVRQRGVHVQQGTIGGECQQRSALVSKPRDIVAIDRQLLAIVKPGRANPAQGPKRRIRREETGTWHPRARSAVQKHSAVGETRAQAKGVGQRRCVKSIRTAIGQEVLQAVGAQRPESIRVRPGKRSQFRGPGMRRVHSIGPAPRLGNGVPARNRRGENRGDCAQCRAKAGAIIHGFDSSMRAARDRAGFGVGNQSLRARVHVKKKGRACGP